MLRIPRRELDLVKEALMIAAAQARNTGGLRVLFTIHPREAERAILGMLTALAPGDGPVTAADTFFMHNPPGNPPDNLSGMISFPPDLTEDGKRAREKT